MICIGVTEVDSCPVHRRLKLFAKLIPPCAYFAIHFWAVESVEVVLLMIF